MMSDEELREMKKKAFLSGVPPRPEDIIILLREIKLLKEKIDSLQRESSVNDKIG